jgi:hypothetical protein
LSWLLPGAALSMVPVLATFPGTRLLLVASLGAAAAMAVLIRECFAARGLWRAFAVWMFLAQVPASLAGWAFNALYFSNAAVACDRMFREAELDDAAAATQRVVLLHAPDPAAAFYLTLARAYFGHPRPAAWWVLSLAPYEHRLTRPGTSTLELEVLNGRMLDTIFEQLMRSPSAPLREGQQVQLAGARVTVLQRDETFPKRLRLEVEVPLEDPSLLFLHWDGQRLRRFSLPAVGESVLLPKLPGAIIW